ncbi:MAG: tetratricopeptide repeat protein [Cyanobacteria bacterium J06560_6]
MSTPLLNHRYRVIKSLAEGGFGQTFLVEDTQMPSRRQCVIKQLKPMNDRPEVFRIVQDRFAREAAVLEAVGKGNSQIPDLYAYFEEGGQFYLVQEWIEGEALINLTQASWPEARVGELLTNALKALAHVHRQNIIHRDIKPDNIILRAEDNLPCLIDFGAVKELMSTVVRQSGATQSSLVIGTPGFMPPEQAAGRPTFSSDLYSLSMTMIFLLTGRSPAELPTNSQTGEILWQQFAPNVGEPLKTILTKAIHPYAQYRYATADAMLGALSPNTVEQAPNTQAPNTMEQAPTTLEQAPIGPPSLQIISTAPATVVSGAGTSSQTAVQQKSGGASTAARPVPWKTVGISAGAFLLALGMWTGARITFNNTPARAQVEDFQDTIQALAPLAEANDMDSTEMVRLARAYHEVGEYEAAIAQAETALAEDDGNIEALLVKGETQLDTGEYTAALDTFNQAIEKDSQSAAAFVQRGITHSEIGEYEKSVEDFRRALQIAPDSASAYREWAYTNIVEGNTQEAVQNLDLSIEKDDSVSNISAYVNRGSRKSELGDRAGAIADWSTAQSMEVSTADEYASRGYAKSRLGNKEGALNDFNQALIVNPNHVRSIVNRAALFYESGDKAQALSTLEDALTINPNHVSGLLLKGEVNAFSNPADWETAIADYTKALETNPKDPSVLSNRCSAYYATQQMDLALADCGLGLQIDPRSTSLYVSRGNIRLTQENYDGSIQDFSKALDILQETGSDPFREATVYSNRASALAQLQDLDGALSDLNKALEIKPDDAPDLYKRGLVKVALNDTEGARADLKKSAEIYTQEGRTDSHRNVIATMEELGL